MVTRQDKRLAVGRLGALVEQIEALVSKDLQVILVSGLGSITCLFSTTHGAGFEQTNSHPPVVAAPGLHKLPPKLFVAGDP